MGDGTIEAVPVTRYRATCSTCDRKFGMNTKQGAEWDLRTHECGVHRQQHDNTGGWRGILGGWNIRCVCGARYVTEDDSAAFHCPKDDATPDTKEN